MKAGRFDNEKLYIRLANTFMSKVLSGEWRTGAQIPTEEELCRAFGVSKITVRRAVDILVFEGYLEKLQGKGTFVKPGILKGALSMRTTLVESVFLPGGRDNISVIEKKTLAGVPEDARALMGQVIDNEILYLARLKGSGGVPVLFNELFIPRGVCPAFADWEPGEGSVFEFLRDNTSHRIARVEQSVEVARPAVHAAGQLKVRPSSPCMVIHRVFTSSAGITVAYSKSTARPDRFRLDTVFERVS